MAAQRPHVDQDVVDHELDPVGHPDRQPGLAAVQLGVLGVYAHDLDELLYDVVAVLVLYASQGVAAELLEELAEVVVREGLEGLLHDPAAVHLEGEAEHVAVERALEVALHGGRAELVELLDDVVAVASRAREGHGEF